MIRRSVGFLGMASVAACIVASTAHAATGRTPGAFNVSSSGSATYMIPIAVPSGPRGVQPKLAITYDSAAGNGALGVGWGISGLSRITRCARTYGQDAGAAAPVTLTYSDAFCLDGKRLRLTSGGGLGSYGQNLTTYQTEIADFSNVTAHGVTGNGPAYFTVQGRDGLTYEYGNAANSTHSQVLATGSATASAWLLDRVVDRANNSMTITYAQPSSTLTGTSVPDTISWTPSSAGSSSYNYTLHFNYTSNVPQSSISSYIAGTSIVNADLLVSMVISHGATVVKKYKLSYETSQSTSRYRLKEVKECADDAESDCLLPTSIHYQDGQAGFAATPTVVLSSSPANVSTNHDFNGDGREDLLFASGGMWYVAFAGVSGFGTPVSTGIAVGSAIDSLNGKLSAGDLNASGQDVLLTKNGTVWWYYKWNGSSFVGTSTGLTYDTTATSFVLTDVNGDGLPDLVTTKFVKNVSMNVWLQLNTSSGGAVSFAVTATNAFSLSTPSATSGAVSGASASYQQIRDLDFDGDGRKDLLLTLSAAGSTSLSRLMSQGTSFVAIGGGTSSPNRTYLNWNDDTCTDYIEGNQSQNGVIYLSACNGSASGTILSNVPVVGTLDWDGDGRMDLLSFNGSTGKLQVLLSTGSGLSAPIATNIPYVGGASYLPVDPNGDSLDDIAEWTATDFELATHNASGTLPDLVTSITDGYGNVFSPSYVSLPNGSYTKGTGAPFPELDIQTPMHVVSQVVASDGIGGTYTQTYSYTGARTDVQRNGFEGFQSVTVSDNRSNSLVSKITYNTGFPFTGMPSASDTFQHDGSTPVAHTVYASGKTDLDTAAGNQRAFVFVQSATVTSYEVGGPKNGVQISTATTTNTYDSFGNATNVVTVVTDDDATSPYHTQQWTSTTATSISPNQGTWCLTQPTQVSVTNTSPGSSRMRTTSFTPEYTNCRESQEVIAPGDGTYAVTLDFSYDSFGNVSGVNTTGVGMTTRSTSTNWGTTGQFPVSTTNALSQATTYGYNYDLGVITSVTDPNGIVTSWVPDTFGRRTRENRPDGTYTIWSRSDCAGSGCVLGSHGLVLGATVYNSDNTVQTDSTTYFDPLDRQLVASTRMLATSAYDRNEVRYDNFGRVLQQAMPCTWTALGTTCPYWTTSSYDALGRVTQIQRPKSSGDLTLQTTTIVYAGRTTTTTDPQSKSSTQVTTVAGTLGRVQDHDGYYQNLTYDAFGSLVGVSDSAGTTLFAATYDYGIGAFQRDAYDSDLDLSNASGQRRHFNYDALGEMTGWTDAKGQAFGQSYDALSRPSARTESDLTTTWTWGNSATGHNIGQLQSVSAVSPAGTYSESYTFDGAGRPANRTIAIPSDGSYTYDYAYGVTGLLDTLTYPNTTSYRLKLQYGYQNGILKSISDFNASTTVFWTANTANARGQVTQETLGNGVVTNRSFDAVTGYIGSQQTGLSGGAALQNESYLFDLVGNLVQRQNNNVGLTESFYYDNVYRLDHSMMGSTANLALTYDSTGNILTKNDVASGATWTYGSSRRHAVTQVGSGSYSYDSNGNLQTGRGLTVSWTSYNHPNQISGSSLYDGSNETVQFSYNQDHERWRAVYSGSTGVETTNFVGGLLEKVITAGSVEYRHYIYAGDSKIAVYSRIQDGANTLRYIREDHEDSVSNIINSDGTSYVKESFNAFGLRRSACTWSGNPTAGNLALINGVTRHGYTWQTALGALGLNDMNGRIQDALTGRFLSPDPYVTEPESTQGYNRYSYVSNNPLSYVDPSGFGQTPALLQPQDPEGGGQQSPRRTFDPDFPWFPNFPGLALWNGVGSDPDFQLYWASLIRYQPVVSRGPIVHPANPVDPTPGLGFSAQQPQGSWLDTAVTDPITRRTCSDQGGLSIDEGCGPGVPATYVAPLTVDDAINAASLIPVVPELRVLKAVNLPGWRRVAIDMAHVLERHTIEGPLSAGRTTFPELMSNKGIERAIREAYRYGTKVATQAERVLMRGKSGLLTIEMWLNRETGIIETAYPIVP